MLLPGVYSVMVPLPSVVVVVVVVCDTCAHANGVASPNAMHSIILFIIIFFIVVIVYSSSVSVARVDVAITQAAQYKQHTDFVSAATGRVIG